MYGITVHTGDGKEGRCVFAGLFTKACGSSMKTTAQAGKLRKLLFALETAGTVEQVGRFPGWKLEPDRNRKLAVDIPL